MSALVLYTAIAENLVLPRGFLNREWILRRSAAASLRRDQEEADAP